MRRILPVGEFNMNSTLAYPSSLQEVLKQEMAGQEIVFRDQVYEFHRLYQTQKTLLADSGYMEVDRYNFWDERLIKPASPYSYAKSYTRLPDGNLSRNFVEGPTGSLKQNWSSDSITSSRDNVDLTLRIGEDSRKKCRFKKPGYRNNSQIFPHCVIDLEASTDTVSQEATRFASSLSYATINRSKQDFPFHVQPNHVHVSTYSSKTDIHNTTVSNCSLFGGKYCIDENSFNLGCKELNSSISYYETLLKRKSVTSNESIKFDFDLNKVQLGHSFDLNEPADTYQLTPGLTSPDKHKGIYSDDASCSFEASCKKVNSVIPMEKNVTKDNLADICDVEITKTLKETCLQPCENKIRTVHMNEGSADVDAIVQEAAELLFHFSLGSSVNNQDCSTNSGSNPTENDENDEIDRPQCSMDSYESLVMKLEETSVDDYCVSSKAFEVEEFEKKETRVFWRRGRRLKDFQKDILPNHVSLSRQEIREDVGAMEAAMRSMEFKRMRSKGATGENWFTPTKCKRSRTQRRYSWKV